MSKPLDNVRILDLSRAISGPYGAMLLADLGADVIHIEPPEGDISRFESGANYKGESFHYLSWNRNKKSLVLDLSTKSGKEAFYDLVKISDVVWNNFRAGAMKRLAADHNTLKSLNPRIISVSITGYGASGPNKDRPAYDIAILGNSGVLSLTGEPGGTPVRPGPPIADMGGGIFAAIGVLAALVEREHTGLGRSIDISMQDTCISLLSYYVCQYFLTGIVPQPLDHSGHAFSVPYGVYKTKKGYLTIGPSWPRIMRAIGTEELIDDPRFKDWTARDKHRVELNKIIEERLSQADAEDWLRILEAEDIPAGVVKDIGEVVVDPQITSRNMLLHLKHSLGGEITLAGNPIKMDGVFEKDYTAPPTLNQQQTEILSGLLGYSSEKITKIKQEELENTKKRREHVRKAR